jgi:ABC-type glycerol-3-phosphate transport system substrate-binding protein
MDPQQPPQKVQQVLQQAVPQPIDPYYGNEASSSPLKKIIIIILGLVGLVLFVLLIFFIISKITSSGQPKNVTLSYWGIWEDSTVMQPLIDDFERAHPNIKINYEKQDIKGLGMYAERLTKRIDNGTGPDIYRFHSSWTPQLKNYLTPFPKTVIASTKLDSDFYKTVEHDMKINGAYYGIPLGIDTLSLFINTTLLNNVGLQPPKDWNDIVHIYGPRLLVKENDKIVSSSIALGTYDNIAHSPDIVAMLLLQNRANIRDLTGSAKTNAEDALTFYTSFADSINGSWNQTLDNSKLAFAKGNLAMFFGFSWDIFEIKALNPNLQFQVVTVPTLAGRKNTVASYWSEGVSARCKNSKEAFEFLDFISQPSSLQKLYSLQSKVRLFGSLYPRRSMQPLLSSNELVYPFISQADDAQSTFFSSDTYDGDTGMVTQMNVYMGNAVRSVNENTSVSSAVDTLSKGVAQVLSRYGN